MSYRFKEVDIPEDNPFKNDVLNRKGTVEFLADLIGRAGESGPFVLAIDAPYGSGKSTFISMLRSVLNKQEYFTVYLNAWQVDSSSDPLVPLVSVLDEALRDDAGAESDVSVNLDKVRAVASILAKRGAIAAAKFATLGILDLEKDIEAVAAGFSGDSTTDLIAGFQKEESLSKRFRSELAIAVEALPARNKKASLVFFIDELDRCRPDFAISLLERIKHMFDIDNVVFVLSIDKKQLEAVTAAIYGVQINAAEYLRKFIDLEFGLPRPSSKRFVEMCIVKAGLDKLFLEKGQRNQQDHGHFVRFFSAISDARSLSLRTQERCITRLRVVLEQTPEHENVEPVLVSLLVVLRAVDEGLFHALVQDRVGFNDVLKFLHADVDGILPSDDRAIIIGTLIGETREPARAGLLKPYEDILAEPTTPPEARRFAARIRNMASYRIERGEEPGLALAAVARRVDIAAAIRN